MYIRRSVYVLVCTGKLEHHMVMRKSGGKGWKIGADLMNTTVRINKGVVFFNFFLINSHLDVAGSHRI